MVRTVRFIAQITISAAFASVAMAQGWQTATVERIDERTSVTFDAAVEPVNLTTVAAQVAGRITDVHVSVGDQVKAGQPLLSIDAQFSDSQLVASEANINVAQAQLNVAATTLQRQRELFKKNYISKAALERAQADYQAAAAQVQAQRAQTQAARTQTGFYALTAPYSGIIANVPATLGQMAMPGTALVSLFDPQALRVSATVSHQLLTQLQPTDIISIQIGDDDQHIYKVPVSQIQILPLVDVHTHTATVRVPLLLNDTTGLMPGMFARLLLPARAAKETRLVAPYSAILQRAELTVVYVIGQNGQPQLRTIRPGPRVGDLIEILSGVEEGDKIVITPQLISDTKTKP